MKMLFSMNFFQELEEKEEGRSESDSGCEFAASDIDKELKVFKTES